MRSSSSRLLEFTSEADWPFRGAVVPGYPDLHPLREAYWVLFWKLYGQQREAAPTEPRKPE